MKSKLLLTTICKPYGLLTRDAEAAGMQMELFNNQITREQGIHSPRINFWTFPLYLLAANVSVPATVLDFPTWRSFKKELRNGYTHVGISFIATNVLKAKKMAEHIREYYPDVKIILGGYGAVLPDLDKIVPNDAVCIGEGVEWLRRYFGDDPAAPIRHPVLPSIAKKHLYGLRSTVQSAAVLLPGLGCKNACFFCSTSHKFNHKYLSILETGEDVFNACREAEEKLGVTIFGVMDENFLKEPERAKQLLAKMEEHGKTYGFFLFASAEVISKLGVDFLARLGACFVWIGIESEKPIFEKLVGQDVRKLIHDLQMRGVTVISSSILFLEHHDRAILDREIDWAISMNSDLHQFMQLTPLPGTPLFERYRSEGKLISEFPYTMMSGQNVLNFYHEHFDSKEAYELTKEAFRRKFEAHGPSVLNMALTSLRGYHYAVKTRENLRNAGLAWNPATMAYDLKNGSHADKFLDLRIDVLRRYAIDYWPAVAVSWLFAPNRACRRRAAEIGRMYRTAFGGPDFTVRARSFVATASAAVETLRAKMHEALGKGEFIRQPPTRRVEYRTA